jgi:hypothetical protein
MEFGTFVRINPMQCTNSISIVRRLEHRWASTLFPVLLVNKQLDFVMCCFKLRNYFENRCDVELVAAAIARNWRQHSIVRSAARRHASSVVDRRRHNTAKCCCIGTSMICRESESIDVCSLSHNSRRV